MTQIKKKIMERNLKYLYKWKEYINQKDFKDEIGQNKDSLIIRKITFQ